MGHQLELNSSAILKLVLVSFCLLLQCTDEEVTSRNYSRVRTGSVDEITESGAIFHGTITYASGKIEDHGFVWSESADLNYKNGEVISIGPAQGKGQFNVEIHRGLKEGQVYYVRAFAKSNGYTVLGEIKSFISLGSLAPVVSEIVPSLGTWGDTVLIKGSNFSRLKNTLRVKFDVDSAAVINAKDDSILCIVPQSLAKIKSDVTVTFSGNSGKKTNSFDLLPPIINSINPSQGIIGDVVTISGLYFSSSHSKVFFNDIEARVIKSTAKSVECKVPVLSASGIVDVRIETGVGLNDNSSFTFLSPSILAASPLTGTFGQEVTLTGSNFPLDINLYQIKVGGVITKPFNVSSNSILFGIPNNLVKKDNEIIVSIGGVETTLPEMFLIAPPEITEILPKDFFPGEWVTVKGKNFSPIKNQLIINGIQVTTYTTMEGLRLVVPINLSNHSVNFEVQTLDQSNVYTTSTAWIRKLKIPSEIPSTYQMVEVANSLYALGQDENKFYRADLETNTWTQLADLPVIYSGQFNFVVQGEIYYGGGFEVDNSLWKYDAVPDNWIDIGQLPFVKQDAVGFSYQSNGYIFGGSDGLGEDPTEVWKFSTQDLSWVKMTSSPWYYYFNLPEQKDDKFVLYGDRYTLFEYSIPADSWQSKEIDSWSDAPIGYYVFHINDRIYFKDGSIVPNNSVHCYDLSNNQWSYYVYRIPSFEYYSPWKFRGKFYYTITNSIDSYIWELDPDYL